METELLPDILQAAGRTPRELGAIQLHAEPVLRGPDGVAAAVVWLQAAFQSVPAGSLLGVLDAQTSEVIAELELPPLERGRAVRWTFPLRVRPEAASLLFSPDAPIPEGVPRIRAPWKLFDTVEQVRESEMGGSPADEFVERFFDRSVRIGEVGIDDAYRKAARELKLTVHRARELPQGYLAPVVATDVPPTVTPDVISLWEEGQPVDTERLRAFTRSGPSTGANCGNCGAVTPPRAEFCPECLSTLAHPSEPESLKAEPDRFPVAPGASLPQGATPCPLHPERAVTGTCVRCGTFYCAQCREQIGDVPEAICPACDARSDAKNPVLIAAKLRKEVSWMQLACAAILGYLVAQDLMNENVPAPAILAVLMGLLTALPLLGAALFLRLVRWNGLLWGTMVTNLVYCIFCLVTGSTLLCVLTLMGTLHAGLSAARIFSLQPAAPADP
ncbi:hypothetical protein P2318_16490 [Myxococcaceae bacterium GXIMD 01537]